MSTESSRGSPPPRLFEALRSCDLVIVGAGLFGLTVAERAASEGFKVAILDRRSQLGGNIVSTTDSKTGIEVHQYGSHLFHTSNEKVWNYVQKFVSFNDYRHRVFAQHNGRVFSMPINLSTMSEFYGVALSPQEARERISRDAASVANDVPDSLEARAIRTVGRPLYEALIRGYTKKQWQVEPSSLPGDVIGRLPVRFTFEDRYFSDTWEGLPIEGYQTWISRMLESTQIAAFSSVDYFDIKGHIPAGVPIVYTGPLDRFFNYRHGPLAWRTLDFEISHPQVGDFQGTSVMNFSDETVPYTRIHEFRHLHPERQYPKDSTVIMHEFSRLSVAGDEPYYPVNSPSDRNRLRRYREDAEKEKNVYFGGRLGSYLYLDMHMAVASALVLFENTLLERLRTASEFPA